MQKSGGDDIRPVPDPTILTTEQLRREISALRDTVFAKFDGDRSVIEARLTGMDRARELLQVEVKEIPPDTDLRISHLQELVYQTFRIYDEKFIGVSRQFEERDVRVLQSAAAATTAVNAALQAAKEAVGEQNKSFTLSIDKSETATMKQIDGQSATIGTAVAGLTQIITDVKDRLTRIEGATLGAATSRQTGMSQNNTVITLMAVIISIVSLVTTFIHNNTPVPTAVAPISVPVTSK